MHINGKLTLGENTADNGGVRVAYMALMDSLAGKTPPKIDGFTPEQRFFLAFGQVWCTNERRGSAAPAGRRPTRTRPPKYPRQRRRA